MSSIDRRNARNRSDAPHPGTRFFLWCAGSERSLLTQLPDSETTKHVGFGTLVLVPAVLGLVSMSYALSTLTEHSAIWIGGGVVWSAIVFAFDRFIVSTLRKTERTAHDVTSPVFLSRLLFALLVGIVVAHPLTLLAFHDSLDDEIGRREDTAKGRIEARATEVESGIELQITELQRQLHAHETERDAYRRQLVAEIDGIVSGRTSGIPGRGASAHEKERQLLAAEQEFATLRSRSLERETELRRQQRTGSQSARLQIEAFELANDYLARVEALESLAARSPHVRGVQLFLVLFFVFVDTLPLLFKGFTPSGPYDALLRAEELRSTDRAPRHPRLALKRSDNLTTPR